MIVFERCLSPIRGLSIRDRRGWDLGDVGGWELSDSEEEEEALDIEGDIEGRTGTSIESREVMGICVVVKKPQAWVMIRRLCVCCRQLSNSSASQPSCLFSKFWSRSNSALAFPCAGWLSALACTHVVVLRRIPLRHLTRTHLVIDWYELPRP